MITGIAWPLEQQYQSCREFYKNNQVDFIPNYFLRGGFSDRRRGASIDRLSDETSSLGLDGQ